ncbi:CopG family antitoxin [Desulfonatronum thioautotrophicum]|uniref:CopG family antitoxin n=1 Tax=Desulfonatronum thioautotrophicum TaxID=617001 RepID=UPI001ABFC76F
MTPGENDERRFWQAHDSVEYMNWSEAETVVLPVLKPSTKSISLRPVAGVHTGAAQAAGAQA